MSADKSWEIITKEDILKSVAFRWENQYSVIGTEWAIKLAEKIPLLKAATTEEEMNNIIGNKHWTQNECYMCEEDRDKALRMWIYGEDVCICKSCLTVMIQAFD